MANDLTIPSPMDESAKAVQEASKLGVSLVSASEKGGSYLASVFGTLPSDWIGMYADRQRHKRWVQYKKLEIERDRLLAEWSVDNPVEPTPAIEDAVMQNALDEDRDEITKLWARLLAAASSPLRRDRVRKSYIELLNRFDPYDAIIFQTVAELIVSGEKIPNEALGEACAAKHPELLVLEVFISIGRLKNELELTGTKRETISYKQYQNYNTDIVNLSSLGLALHAILFEK